MVQWFIIGFFVLFIVRSLNFLPPSVLEASKWISTQFEVIALGAIGMRVKFADIIKEGQKSLTYGLIVGTLQILLGILLIHAFFG